MRLSYQDSALTSMKGVMKGLMKDIEKDFVKGIARDQTACMTIHDGVPDTGDSPAVSSAPGPLTLFSCDVPRVQPVFPRGVHGKGCIEDRRRSR